MSGPPANVKPSDLLLKLAERPRPTTAIDFPVNGPDEQPIGKCKLWVLRESELHVARAQADIAAREIMGKGAPRGTELSFGYEDIYRNELAIQLVAMACRDADDPKFPVFPSAKSARQALTTDELGVLSTAYEQFRVESGPMLSDMTLDEMEAWASKLQEGGASFGPLSYWPGETLRAFIKFLVSKLKTSLTDTGSSGSPCVDTSQDLAADASSLVDESERAKPE